MPPGPSGKPRPISPAIDSISNSQQLAHKIRTVTNAVKIILSVIAVLLLVVSLMLVANTIRLSIYARRREIRLCAEMLLEGRGRAFSVLAVDFEPASTNQGLVDTLAEIVGDIHARTGRWPILYTLAQNFVLIGSTDHRLRAADRHPDGSGGVVSAWQRRLRRFLRVWYTIGPAPVSGGPQVERRRGFILGFGAGAVRSALAARSPRHGWLYSSISPLGRTR